MRHLIILITNRARLKLTVLPQIKIRRLSAFLGARGTFHSLIGTFDINILVGPSYIEAYNDTLDTSKVEPTFPSCTS